MRAAVLLLLLASLAGCAPMPQRASIPTRWLPSPNFDARRPNFVILHHTGSDNAQRALTTLTAFTAEVSAHYLIARDGAIWQLVDERARAWHAGDSYWAGMTDLNSASIGIELDNDGEEPFRDAQVDALLALLADLETRYHIPAANILGHGDIAPGRKVDPSAAFPWRRLAEHGFGLWCDPPEVVTVGAAAVDDEDSAEALVLLTTIGYDVTDPEAAIAAYRRHFRGDESEQLDAIDLPLLECLVERKMTRTPNPSALGLVAPPAIR